MALRAKSELKEGKFEGYLPPFSRENESEAWLFIMKQVDEALKAYPTTKQEDDEILQKDEENKCLERIERNCIVYRYIEKAILHYFKECGEKV